MVFVSIWYSLIFSFSENGLFDYLYKKGLFEKATLKKVRF